MLASLARDDDDEHLPDVFVGCCADRLMHVCNCWQLGGPSWSVPLGRRDSPKAASTSMVLQFLIPATSSLAELIEGYDKLGLNPTDLVALSGTCAPVLFILAHRSVALLISQVFIQ
jgi:hypothetical protein